MSDTSIRVNSISKKYKIGQRRNMNTLTDSISNSASNLFKAVRSIGRPSDNAENNKRPVHWALKDVSFEVKQGEVLGIIGRNGSGKSTLLKILSRITRPTEGCFELWGRFGALLEVGTGFHPELTGRENVFLNGSILGMRRAEIEKKFDSIVAFSEVEKFIDTPAKFYSSGMYVRLAFSVAAHLDTDILILDEVLSVGDIGFRQKSLAKMKSVAHDGRTVVVVSHDMTQLSEICTSVMWLDQGVIRRLGDKETIINEYETHTITAPEELANYRKFVGRGGAPATTETAPTVETVTNTTTTTEPPQDQVK